MGLRRAFYRTMTHLSRRLGPGAFSLSARGIAAAYFWLFPGRVRIGMDFYRALYPQRPAKFHRRCTWKQFQNFTSVYLDRLRLLDFSQVGYTCRGWEHLEAAMAQKTGGIILMSHLGNWEVAAHLMKMKAPGMRLLLYMGARGREQIEGIQKQDLARGGIRIIAADPQNPSPWDIIEAVGFIRAGGFVSMTGDRVWTPAQRTLTVDFLGRRARIPEAPHALALVTGAPLWVFFSFRTGPARYHFTLSEPIRLPPVPRARRSRALRLSAQIYARMLEQALRQNPLEWYHFEPFLLPERASQPSQENCRKDHCLDET